MVVGLSWCSLRPPYLCLSFCETTSEQDDTLIQQMNASSNHTSFNLLLSNNCADFSRILLNHIFPHTFAWYYDYTKQTAYRLVQYARKHPEIQLMFLRFHRFPLPRKIILKSIDVIISCGALSFHPQHPEILTPMH